MDKPDDFSTESSNKENLKPSSQQSGLRASRNSNCDDNFACISTTCYQHENDDSNANSDIAQELVDTSPENDKKNEKNIEMSIESKQQQENNSLNLTFDVPLKAVHVGRFLHSDTGPRCNNKDDSRHDNHSSENFNGRESRITCSLSVVAPYNRTKEQNILLSLSDTSSNSNNISLSNNDINELHASQSQGKTSS